MNTLFNETLSFVSDSITVSSCILTILVSLALGLLIALCYKITSDKATYQDSLALTLIILPVILSAVILFIGNNLARAFSLAGTLSLIRFRSNPGDARDIAYLFFAVCAGLACGVGLFGYGALFTVILCTVLFVLHKWRFFESKNKGKTLRILVPETLCFQDAFTDIFQSSTEEFTLDRIRTTDLGSLYELTYSIRLKESVDIKAFLDSIRTRNGNLTVTLTDAATEIKKNILKG